MTPHILPIPHKWGKRNESDVGTLAKDAAHVTGTNKTQLVVLKHTFSSSSQHMSD